MRVVIAGGHGKIALLLGRALAGRGDAAVGLVRDPGHVADVRATGADAAVFAAGAGPGSGIPRKDTVDRAAAVLLADAAEAAGVRRYLQVSAMGVDSARQSGPDDVFGAYLVAKKAAEDDLRARAL